MQLTSEQIRAFGKALDNLMNPGVERGVPPSFGFVLIAAPLEPNAFVRFISNLAPEDQQNLCEEASRTLRSQIRKAKVKKQPKTLN